MGRANIFSFLISTTLVLTALTTRVYAQDTKAAQKKICSDKPGTDWAFPKGHEFRIIQYHAPTRTYYIESVRYPGEGASIVTPENLIAGVKEIRDDQAHVLQNPKSILRKTYVSEVDFAPLKVEERDARNGCVPK